MYTVISFLFSLCLFISAALLFTIQPMVAKVLLPIYGGTPAVWTICMLFFQALLLGAYGYVWLLSQCQRPWLWRILHGFVILLSLTALPLTFSSINKASSPDFAILNDLIRQLGLPLLVLAASAPLLQYAYSQTKAKQAGDPYFLYSASNIGSFLALFSYPWLIERFTGLNQQFYYWNIAFITYLSLLIIILISIRYKPLVKCQFETKAVSWRLILQWLAYSFIPCSLMLGVTFYISTDIAATPLFWLLPLALYLLSFIITFANKPIISHSWVKKNSLFFLIFPILGFIFGANLLRSWELISFHLVSFFMLALLCHGELIRKRPSAYHLTSFYFCLALGGVLAGMFNGLVAPHVFAGAYEYPIVFTLALLCISLPKQKNSRFLPFIVFILLTINYLLLRQHSAIWLTEKHIIELIVLISIFFRAKNRVTLFTSTAILFIFLFSPWFKSIEILNQQRNFYGVKQVLSMFGANVLVSQSTLHGFQLQTEPRLGNGSMAYYGPVLPIVQRLQKKHEQLKVTILGLGTGMLACQFRAMDKIAIIDIDKEVIDIASNSQFFTYLKDCPPSASLIEGDGRLTIAERKNANTDLLIVDAFTSDAVPTHLLTLEAFKIYQQKITSAGIIMANISNRHLNLLPVLTAAGRTLQLIVLHKFQEGNNSKGQFPAEWVLLTANETFAAELMQKENWRFVAEDNAKLWTDDYSNIIPLLKW